MEHFSRYGFLDETDSDEDALGSTSVKDSEPHASLPRGRAAAIAADGHDAEELQGGSDMQEGALPASA